VLLEDTLNACGTASLGLEMKNILTWLCGFSRGLNCAVISP
jgi:hypothetical protein